MKYAICILLLLAGPAFAEWPYDAVCDVANGNSGGSATLVAVSGDEGLVISCAHVFEPVQNPVFDFPGYGKWRGRCIGISRRHDLSAFIIKNPPPIGTPAGVCAARDEDGPFTCVGFPWYGQGEMHWTSGDLVGIDSYSRANIAARPHVHSGYSGGALFNRHGEFCGVVCGYKDNGLSYAPANGVLLDFVGQWMEVEE